MTFKSERVSEDALQCRRQARTISVANPTIGTQRARRVALLLSLGDYPVPAEEVLVGDGVGVSGGGGVGVGVDAEIWTMSSGSPAESTCVQATVDSPPHKIRFTSHTVRWLVWLGTNGIGTAKPPPHAGGVE